MVKNCVAIASALSAFSYLCVGCSPAMPIGTHTISQLLVTALVPHCDPQLISVRADVVGIAKAQQAINWFNRDILPDHAFRQVLRSSDSSDRHGVLTYRDAGNSFDITWGELDIPGIDVRDSLAVSTCIYIPAHVEIIDSDFDDRGTEARVLFEKKKRLSRFAQRMRRAGFLRPRNLTKGLEFVADLHRSALGSWTVRSWGVE